MAISFFALHGIVSALAATASARQDTFETPRPVLVASSISELSMEPAPINPDWVISGSPQARIAEHSQSADNAAVTAIWDCTAGEFRWFFGWDETVMILEGQVTVTDEQGLVRTLKQGDVAYFAGNSWATWKVDNYVRKIAFVRRPMPLPVVLAMRLKSMLTRMQDAEPGALRSRG